MRPSNPDSSTGQATSPVVIESSLLSFSSHSEREGEATPALLVEGATQAPVVDNPQIDAIITIKRVL
jgi:hypothetical protein